MKFGKCRRAKEGLNDQTTAKKQALCYFDFIVQQTVVKILLAMQTNYDILNILIY